MTDQLILPVDEERSFRVMSEYNDLMRSLDVGPVPMCHFTPMEFHDCDSDPSGRSDGYECQHCGHSVGSTEAWAKVRARETRLSVAAQSQTKTLLDKAII